MKKTAYKGVFNVGTNGQNLFKITARKGKETKTKTLPAGTTLRQAVRERQALVKDLEEKHSSIAPLLNAFFLDYIEGITNIQSEKTVNSKIASWNKHIKPRFGNMKLDQLQPMQVQTMVNELLVDFKPKTVVNIIDVLSRLYKIAIANELVTKNPCSALELPKFDNQINFTMSKPKIHALVKVILNHRHMDYHGIFTFLLHGRRLGEVLNLEWSQIDFDSGIYEIPYIKNKARKNMRYILTDQLKTIIVRQLQHRTPSSPYVFTNPTTNTQYKSVSKAWKKIKEDAGIVQHMRIHDIRHLLGYYSVNFLNMPLEHVQQTLGHVDIKTTQRYVNDRPETSHKVMTTFFDSFNDP